MRSLADYKELELYSEIGRRESCRREGRCDYCGRPGHAPACRYPGRHALARLCRCPPAIRHLDGHLEGCIELQWGGKVVAMPPTLPLLRKRAKKPTMRMKLRQVVNNG